MFTAHASFCRGLGRRMPPRRNMMPRRYCIVSRMRVAAKFPSSAGAYFLLPRWDCDRILALKTASVDFAVNDDWLLTLPLY